MNAPTAGPTESYNPYQPPKADVTAAPDPDARSRMRLASAGRRFANLLLDYVGILLFTFLVGMLFGLIGQEDLIDQTNDTLFGILMMLLYYVGAESLFGVTFGKLITGTRVVMEDGSRAGVGRIIVRTLCRFIPFEAFTFLQRSGVGLHDGLSKTRVILTRGGKEQRA
ncbi:RDD family protein [Sorangium sp. So ce131]|uniref:RDD family protein n=1 Tax=Sorangium sp. So ce131 TaxID=3133282 RepID=UPI003F60FCFC